MNYLCLSSVLVILTVLGMMGIDSQGFAMSVTSNETMQKHANHSLDNLIVSQHISLSGGLLNGDYILLMDLTPFVTNVEEHSHIAIKIPCNLEGSLKATIVAGVAPHLKTLNLGASDKQWNA